MTPAEHVLIRGKCFLYKQKAPFVPSGKSVFGALEYDEETDRVRCHECGEWFNHLGCHLRHAHGLLGDQYRDKHGINRKSPLCGPRMSAKISVGKEDYYRRLRLACRTPEARARFAQIARAHARSRTGRRIDAERRNETGHCQAQLLERLRKLCQKIGRRPSHREITEDGISVSSTCLVFNVRAIGDVLDLLNLPYPKKHNGYSGYSREVLVELIRDFYARYGVLPTCKYQKLGLIPRWAVFRRVFGSMAAAYEAAGLGKVRIASAA